MLNCPTDSICIRQNYHDKKEKKNPPSFMEHIMLKFLIKSLVILMNLDIGLKVKPKDISGKK